MNAKYKGFTVLNPIQCRRKQDKQTCAKLTCILSRCLFIHNLHGNLYKLAALYLLQLLNSTHMYAVVTILVSTLAEQAAPFILLT